MTATAPRSAPAHTLQSASAAATRRLGARLGHAAHAGTCLALVGPLGAGKTQVAKGVARGLGIRGIVNSPTFIIINEHPGGRLPFFHVDAYRLEDVEEARQAGAFDERQADGVTVIEWADRLEGWLPQDHLRIELEADPSEPDRRVIRLFPFGTRHRALARTLADALARAPAEALSEARPG